MDFSASVSENESISEVETLKQQLNTYKMINADLSKKIQELKVELNAFKQENSVLKREVLDERAKAVESRQLFKTMNAHCYNFINTYVNAMQQINENNESLIEGIPGIEATPKSDDDNESPQSVTIVPQIERQRPAQHTVRSHLHPTFHDDEETGGNALNTILEESALPFTSTPIVPGNKNSAPRFSSPAMPIPPTNMFKTPGKRNSSPVVPNAPKHFNSDPISKVTAYDSSSSSNVSPNVTETPRNRILDIAPQVPANDFSSSTLNTSQTVTETPKLSVNHSSRRITIAPEDEIEEYPEKENETAGDDTTEHTVHHETVKEVRVALSPLTKTFLKNHNNNNNTNTESPEYESCEDESTMGSSQSTLKNSKALKRKSSESGRPRRQARPDPKSLKEPSLRTKLRRSKKKV